MLTLMEFCDEFRISHGKAKRMLAKGVLLVADASSAEAARMRAVFMQRNPLSAVDLCTLLEDPGLILQLGKFADRAHDQLETVGNAIEETAPRDVALCIADASQGDPASVGKLVAWIKGVLPDSGEVGHAWIACRLLLAFPANIRQFEAPRIIRALAKCRKAPEFAGYWRQEKKGTRKTSYYFRPNSLANFDL